MKNFLVHVLALWRTEDKSASRMNQAALVPTLPSPWHGVSAQNFPDASELLANVRLRQSQQEIDLRGQLRQDAKIVPFHLVQNGPVVRYIFSNPDETLQVRIGVNDSRLDEIKRSGSEKITQLNEPVRGVAITYEHRALKFLYWPNAHVIGADFIRTRNCWKLQLQAPPGDSQYAGIMLCVDKDDGALMRIEGYESDGSMVNS